ncbi:MAG: hypothetical protein AB1441_05155 [Bacillota bacterium]
MKRQSRRAAGRLGWRRLTVLMFAGFMLVGLVGYSTFNRTTPQAPTGYPEAAREQVQRELEALLVKSAGVDGLQYRLVTNYPLWSYETRVWLQGDWVKTETVVDGQSLVLLVDTARGELLSYDAAENTATRMRLGEGEAGAPETPLDYVRDLNPAEWVPGEVTFLDGLRCRKFTREEVRGATVLYLWEEYGLPLRVESVADGCATVVEFKDLEVGAVPDDVFALPTGVEVTDFWEEEAPSDYGDGANR